MVPKFNSYGEVSPSIVPIIKEGELVNTLVSSRTAAEYKQTTNYAEPGEFLRSPKMEAGSLQQEDVLKALDTGLYLSNII